MGAMRTALPQPTVAEANRIALMMDLGCLPCASVGYFGLTRKECHHLVSGNRRLGHWYTLCLCAGHHQGLWTADQRLWIVQRDLVAISDGRKAFKRIYGTELDMWLKTQHLLELDDELPQSKILPRRVA